MCLEKVSFRKKPEVWATCSVKVQQKKLREWWKSCFLWMMWNVLGKKHRLVRNRWPAPHTETFCRQRHHRSLLALSPELIMGDIYCSKRFVSSVETDKQNYLKPCGNLSTCSYRIGWTPDCQILFTDTFKLNICELCFWSCYNFCSFTKIWAIKVSSTVHRTQATAQK